MDLNKLAADDKHAGKRWKGELWNNDHKYICSVHTRNAPIKLPAILNIVRYDKAAVALIPLQSFPIYPLSERDHEEWMRFLNFLQSRTKVAILQLAEGTSTFLLLPQPAGRFDSAIVYYMQYDEAVPMSLSIVDVAAASKAAAKMHPEYLTTLSQTHASWLFGAVAELVDNARDASAEKLDISIVNGSLRKWTVDMPMLRFLDNGVGMSHQEMVQMISFGHKKPDEDNPDQIGRFGVGFKTGAMRLGKDAIVFTQRKDTRSIALLSTSYNEGKDDLEVPIVTYTWRHKRMEYDTRAQPNEQAELMEKAIIDFSPFDEYGIGSVFSCLGEASGTSIYIYNLEKRGSDYSLSWDDDKHDICIRSMRVRTRPGQRSQEVPLDYSLRAYLELIFLEPHMIMSIQGEQVETKQLAKTLNKTKVVNDVLHGKAVELTLGLSQAEVTRGNCGVFLYWHGRLIEVWHGHGDMVGKYMFQQAYKRVGAMVHSADWGRGVIGVIDTTLLMEFNILNNKQGFEDSEEYGSLENWLGTQADIYWSVERAMTWVR